AEWPFHHHPTVVVDHVGDGGVSHVVGVSGLVFFDLPLDPEGGGGRLECGGIVGAEGDSPAEEVGQITGQYLVRVPLGVDRHHRHSDPAGLVGGQVHQGGTHVRHG